MAQNRLPGPITELLHLAGLNLTGIQQKGATIGLLQYTTANFSPKVSALTTKQTAFNDARSNLFLAYVPVHTVQADFYEFGLMARKILSISLGEDWTTAWAEWGWMNQTTQVPQDLVKLKALLAAIKVQLVAQPDYEVDTVKIAFTAFRIDALMAALAGPETALATAQGIMDTARDDREAAETALRAVMRGLIEVLVTLLDPNSPTWDIFGLNRPGASVTPGQAAQPVLSPSGAGAVTAQTEAVPGATYYRWKYKVLPVDTTWRFWGRTDDPVAVLTDLPASGTLEVICEAANEAGPGKASPKAVLALG